MLVACRLAGLSALEGYYARVGACAQSREAPSKGLARARREPQWCDPAVGCRWRRDGGRVIPVGEKLGRIGLT